MKKPRSEWMIKREWIEKNRIKAMRIEIMKIRKRMRVINNWKDMNEQCRIAIENLNRSMKINGKLLYEIIRLRKIK